MSQAPNTPTPEEIHSVDDKYLELNSYQLAQQDVLMELYDFLTTHILSLPIESESMSLAEYTQLIYQQGRKFDSWYDFSSYISEDTE